MKAFCGLFLVLLLPCTGCIISRVTANGHVRSMKTDWIEPGKTTRGQIIAKLGYPSAQPGEGGGAAQDQLRYQSLDTRSYIFEGGIFLSPTFEKTVTRSRHDILITFDKQGVVKRISRVEDDSGAIRVLEYRETKP